MPSAKANPLIVVFATVLCIGLPISSMGKGAQGANLSQLLAVNLSKSIPQPQTFVPVPQAKAPYWREAFPANIRNGYIGLGKRYHGKEWEQIPASLFAEYKKNGNRYNYEKQSFEFRRRLACLVIAEIMDYQGLFISDIMAGLNFFINETWWGVPAHYSSDKPNSYNQVVDLFNAETASLIAWTSYMLHEELEQQQKGITTVLNHEIQRRMLTPARTINYDWKKRTSNWNPWICSNWLACILFCEENRDNQLNAISQIMTCLDSFIDGNPNDGGCEEGVNYWDRAGGSMFETLYLLQLACKEDMPYFSQAKIQAIAKFPYRMYIGNDRFVNFADCYSSASLHPNIMYPFGRSINDSTLMAFAAQIAKIQKFNSSPAVMFENSGNYPTLGRELLFLAQYKDFILQEPAEPVFSNSWLPNLQVFTVQSESSTGKLFLAAKGGHNNESHNHNDIGNFIVYKDAEPIVIDIGAGSYTAQTFSNKRYELFNCRSAYHNVPIINGFEQHEGKDYRATNVKYKNKTKRATFTLDLSQAYPKEANIKKWRRTIQLNRDKDIVITENYKLKEYIQPSEIVLICCGEARLDGTSNIIINNGKNTGILHFDSNQLVPSIEKIIYQDSGIYNAWQKKDLYRIKLAIRSKALKGEISYSIK